MSKNYYETLGVEKGASKDEIKKSFHKLAHKHHPDKNSGDDKKFKELNEAYQVLSDDEKRSRYDQFGSLDGPQGFGGGQGFGGQGGFGGFDFSGGFQGGQGFDMGDLGDIFGDFFGGGGRSSRKVKRGRDLQVEVDLKFEESIFGVKKNYIYF
jgi:molecular chaperone DnaJ